MARCLEPKDMEALITGAFSSRRGAVARRHITECEACARAVTEAEANEAWLQELRAARELGELRRRVATNAAAQTTATLTSFSSD